MAITVKKLIAELEKIENKHLEVEVEIYDKATIEPEVIGVNKSLTKCYLRLKRSYQK